MLSELEFLLNEEEQIHDSFWQNLFTAKRNWNELEKRMG